MTGEAFRFAAQFPEIRPGVRILPIVHDRVDMASAVRLALEELDPAAVAVELPPTLAPAVRRAVRRLPQISLILSEEQGEDPLVWVSAPGEPLAEALRWAEERGRPAFFIDPDLPYPERHAEPIPDPYAIWSIGAGTFLRLLAERGKSSPRSEHDRARESGMAHYVDTARRSVASGLLLVLMGAHHVHAVAAELDRPRAAPFARVRRSRVDLRHLHPDSLTALLPDPPLSHAAYEILRAGERPEKIDLEDTLSRKISVTRHGLRLITGEPREVSTERPLHLARYAARHASRRAAGSWFPDRRSLESVVWRVGSGSYREQTQEGVHAWQRRMFHDFARRQARLRGLLLPGLYEWVISARGVADDNLAWEVFEAARAYPWQKESAEIPTARVDGDELDLGTRRITFRKRFLRVKQRPVRVPVRERPGTDRPEEWIEAFDVSGLCSHPPEDLVIEDYARFLKQKAASILSVERKRTEPFTTSLLDGIDVRETLRNLHEGRIYVQELARTPGEAGAVVVIFDRDHEGDRFPYRMTWLGEHQQESDMAFYSTSPAEQVVGPGILRATYGGLMMSYPPRRLFDVWSDPDYRAAREKAEVLVMAAVDYSQERWIVHVAAHPPSRAMARYAAARGKRIVHVPLGSLSPVTLRKIRVVHLLAGHDKRAVAKNYIW